jgi:hypothetical protein
MPKTIRESKMLENVRKWRAEAFDVVRQQTLVQRQAAAAEWARRLNLPILGDDETSQAIHAKTSTASHLRPA